MLVRTCFKDEGNKKGKMEEKKLRKTIKKNWLSTKEATKSIQRTQNENLFSLFDIFL